MAKPRKQTPVPLPRRPVRTRSSRTRAVRVGAAAVGIFVLLVLAAWSLWRGRAPQGSTRLAATAPLIEDEQKVFARYVGSASCRGCHEEQYDLWKTSHHGLAERAIQSDRDRLAFDPPRSLRYGTQTSEFQWTNGTAKVTVLGLSGKAEAHHPVRVIGEDPLRQFLVPFPAGRFQVLETAYDPHSNQWFNVYGNEDRRPGEWGHWTGRGMNWNFMCASCHNTRLRRNYDEPSDSYHTTMAEMSVGCEACHGPLKAHNDWQQKFGKTTQKDPTVTKPTRGQVLDYCSSCHARRTDLTGDFKPGDPFLDHFDLVVVDRSDRYYADGQVRDEDYEYASFLGSRMHARGVYCLDCHNPHSMKTLLPGNWLCLRCHSGGDTNAPVINPVAHSRHKVFGFDT
ncbi:MAG TPA: multiheme c-type cytochrome, partial [Candidatus Binatia bacterium]|nr:multiheme c-type cytochrome [Candidatus Binatia bacterium]